MLRESFHLESERAGLLVRPGAVELQEFVSVEGSTPRSTASAEPPLALMMAPGFERLRDSELCHQSGKKRGKYILRSAFHLRCQPVWLNLWFRRESGTNPVLSHQQDALKQMFVSVCTHLKGLGKRKEVKTVYWKPKSPFFVWGTFMLRRGGAAKTSLRQTRWNAIMAMFEVPKSSKYLLLH